MTHMPMDDGRHVRDRLIKTFQIEPSMGCQLECPGCIKRADRSGRVARTRFGHVMLRPEVLAKIVMDLTAANVTVRKFDLQGHGEPLLNKQVWDMCGMLATHYPGSVVSICTHANAAFQDGSVESGVNEMLFAINGVDQASYDPWRVGGNFERAYRFMHRFSTEADKRAPHIRRIWKYVLFSHNDTAAQLLRAQRLALDARITTPRFVVTQLGPASSRVFELADIPILDPALDIVVDSYRIDIAQLDAALTELGSLAARGDAASAQPWAAFLASSLSRLFQTRPALARNCLPLAEEFLEVTGTLPAHLLGRYDEIVAKSVAGTAGYCEGRLPAEPRIDGVWYLAQNSDVAAAGGALADPAEHFRRFGYAEGRAPEPAG